MSNGMRNSMSELPEELSGAELDAVTGGQAIGSPVAAGGLVNVAVGPTNVDVLRGADIDVTSQTTTTSASERWSKFWAVRRESSLVRLSKAPTEQITACVPVRSPDGAQAPPKRLSRRRVR